MDIHSPVNAVDEDIISKLGSTFGGSLHIQNDQKLEHASDEDDIDNFHVGRSFGGFEQQETTLKVKSLKECSTFPYPDTVLPSSSSDDEEAYTLETELLSKQSPHQSYSCTVSQPAPQIKLVSAMKGSRQKHEGSQVKLSVKWDPEVYDPVPTLSSHTVRIKKHHKSKIKKSEKKYVKKGQKGNYSKGGSGKEKKQYNYKWPESCCKGFDASMELNNLDVASHDSYHGISDSKILSAKENPCHVGEALSNILDFISYIKTS